MLACPLGDNDDWSIKDHNSEVDNALMAGLEYKQCICLHPAYIPRVLVLPGRSIYP